MSESIKGGVILSLRFLRAKDLNRRPYSNPSISPTRPVMLEICFLPPPAFILNPYPDENRSCSIQPHCR